jgi:hypothetical protein
MTDQNARMQLPRRLPPVIVELTENPVNRQMAPATASKLNWARGCAI